MRKIELLPKFYSNEERDLKIHEVCNTIDELLVMEKRETVICELKGIKDEFHLLKDTYSRNYDIKRINRYIQ